MQFRPNWQTALDTPMQYCPPPSMVFRLGRAAQGSDGALHWTPDETWAAKFLSFQNYMRVYSSASNTIPIFIDPGLAQSVVDADTRNRFGFLDSGFSIDTPAQYLDRLCGNAAFSWHITPTGIIVEGNGRTALKTERLATRSTVPDARGMISDGMKEPQITPRSPVQ